MKIGESSGPDFHVIWSNVPLGTYTLVARARDNLGSVGISAAITIHVVSQFTSVAIISPAEGTLVLAGTAVSLNATASNSFTAITNVAFLIDGIKITDDPAAPYAGTWTATAGNHLVRAVATDAHGLMTTSAPVNFFAQAYQSSNIVLFPSNAIWKYLDTGANLGNAYTNIDFNDAGWASGPAEFGYGDGDEATIVSFGSNTNNRYITHYFRLMFVLPSTDGISSSILRVLRDDGAIGYLNGAEVHRSNIPTGAVTYTTYALTSVNASAETTYYPTNVNPALFLPGTNIVAFEVHQVTNNSADMSFAADLSITRTAYGPAITRQPADEMRAAGDTAEFNVSAIGTGPLSYQWYHDGHPIPGAVFNTLLVGDLHPADAGNYSVVVSNFLGTATSRLATLIVQPFLTPGWNVNNGHFQLGFEADAARSYSILSSSDLITWNLVTTLSGLSGPVQWEDPSPASAQARFYRVTEH